LITDKGKAIIGSFLDNEVRKEMMNLQARNQALGAIQTTTKPEEAFEDADLVIEGVYDYGASKK
jgi:3-hydroxyacyl-CoA dehydrogenase